VGGSQLHTRDRTNPMLLGLHQLPACHSTLLERHQCTHAALCHLYPLPTRTQAPSGSISAKEALHILGSLGDAITADDKKTLLSERGVKEGDMLNFKSFCELLTPK
jgi:hypothetical protein